MAKSDQARGKAAREAVEKLIAEQKFEAAAAECARIRGEARKNGDTALWTWALIREGQLRTSLHGYETAVRFFKEEAWPDSPLERDMLDLFFANSLVTYYRAYSWDINQREQVEAKGPIDLKSWTRDQIFAEAWAALFRVWKDRDRLSDRKPGEYPYFWSAGTYPAGVRDTLRDAVVYLMARLLSDTAFWTPRQSNETWLLDLPKLLSQAVRDGRTSAADAAKLLESTASHPVEKVAALLGIQSGACAPAPAAASRPPGVEALASGRGRPGPHPQAPGELSPPSARIPGRRPDRRSWPKYAGGGDARRPRRLIARRRRRFPIPGGQHCRISSNRSNARVCRRADAARRRSAAHSRHSPEPRPGLFARPRPEGSSHHRSFSHLPQGKTPGRSRTRAPPRRTRPGQDLDYRDHHTYADLPKACARPLPRRGPARRFCRPITDGRACVTS
jgi:hypothetical protein